MAKLSDQQKLFVVQRLACFYNAVEVQAELKQTHGVEVTLPAITYYDPTTAEGERLAPALKQLFHKTREQFITDQAAIPIAHQNYRLRRLQGIVDRGKGRNSKTELAALEQAAKEVGGQFTNRSQVTVLRQMQKEVEALSDEELLAVVSGGEHPAAAGGGGGKT